MHSPASNVILGGLSSLEPSAQEANFIRKYSPLGITLFSRNIGPNHTNVIRLKSIFENLSGKPALMAVDQEGGRVRRFKAPFPNLGAALQLFEGRCDQKSLESLEKYGFEVGSSLNTLRVDINFAPVAGLHLNPKNTCIGDRCFSDDPHKATLRAGSFLKGMQNAGVLGCLKHFPGQGRGQVDTHLGRDFIDSSLSELEESDLIPFLKLMNQVNLVMISHSVFSKWDPTPASLSKKIMTDFLKDKMGFAGVVVSDDFNMKAISQNHSSWLKALKQSIMAGCDLILICEKLERWEAAISYFNEEAKKDHAFKNRLEEAAEKCYQLKSITRT